VFTPHPGVTPVSNRGVEKVNQISGIPPAESEV
jgi:hypothetical protein